MTDGTLRIGDAASLAQHALAGTQNEPCCELVAAGRSLYWANVISGRNVIQAYDFDTGAIRTVAAGWDVASPPGRRVVYIAQSSVRLLVLPAAGAGPVRRLRTPRGWYLVPRPWATDAGVVVSSRPDRPREPSPLIGIWQLQTGTVQVIGHGHVQTTATPPGAHYSLIAWQPTGCGLVHCPIKITNTATRRTLTVQSPLRYGFLNQGIDLVFSPDGSKLAGFISLDGIKGRFVPALVSTRTGSVRILRDAILANPELGGWAVWLSDDRLLAGPSVNPVYPAYAIDARTAALRRFTFFPRSHDTPDDITYGAVLLPRTDARLHGEKSSTT